jgi:hypothetical protein
MPDKQDSRGGRYQWPAGTSRLNANVGEGIQTSFQHDEQYRSAIARISESISTFDQSVHAIAV